MERRDYGIRPLRYHSRVAIANFLFGSGWWVPWHLLFLLSAAPMFFSLRRIRNEKPGDEPSAGDLAYKVLVGTAFALLLATIADAGMLGWRLGQIRGAMWGTIAGLVFCTIWTLVLFAFARRSIVPADDPAQTTKPAVAVLAVWHAGIVAANLVTLAKINP